MRMFKTDILTDYYAQPKQIAQNVIISKPLILQFAFPAFARIQVWNFVRIQQRLPNL
jgi:hypothetical protein